jgi:hypothetical protein
MRATTANVDLLSKNHEKLRNKSTFDACAAAVPDDPGVHGRRCASASTALSARSKAACVEGYLPQRV